MNGEFSIQEASLLLNVPAPTIRSWERRYGVPVVDRSEGGHRRYTSTQLKVLRRIRDEIASGRTARVAARTASEEQSSPSSPRIVALLDAVDRLDSTTVSQLLDSSSRTLGLARTLDEVWFPVMREVGHWWETGRCDFAQEQLATETSRAWLLHATQTRPAVTAAEKTILLTCGPRDFHTIGLESIAALLSQRGRACLVLGAQTPAASLRTAVDTTGAAAVVMVSHLPSARRAAITSLRGIRETNTQIFYAGNAFRTVQSRTGVPGKYLGTNLSHAADAILADLITSPENRPPKVGQPSD